jgi:hypothetical protein
VVAIVATVMVATFTVALRPLTFSPVRPLVTAVSAFLDWPPAPSAAEGDQGACERDQGSHVTCHPSAPSPGDEEEEAARHQRRDPKPGWDVDRLAVLDGQLEAAHPG